MKTAVSLNQARIFQTMFRAGPLLCHFIYFFPDLVCGKVTENFKTDKDGFSQDIRHQDLEFKNKEIFQLTVMCSF